MRGRGRARARFSRRLSVLALPLGALGLFGAAPAAAQTTQPSWEDVNFQVVAGDKRVTVSWSQPAGVDRVFIRWTQKPGTWQSRWGGTDTAAVCAQHRDWGYRVEGSEGSYVIENTWSDSGAVQQSTTLVNGKQVTVQVGWSKSPYASGRDCRPEQRSTGASGQFRSSSTGGTYQLFRVTPASAPPPTGATLSGLTATQAASSSGPFTSLDIGTFAASTTSYTANVANSVTYMKITPTVAQSGASVEVGKQGQTLATVSSGTASAAIALSEGANAITVKVTASDGQTTGTYTVTVTRAAATESLMLKTRLAASGVSDPVEGADAQGGGIVLVIVEFSPRVESTTVVFELGGTATKGADYTIDSETLTFGVGDTGGQTNINILQDDVYDPDETITIRATIQGTSETSNQVKLTIKDDDAPPPTYTDATLSSLTGNTSTDGLAFTGALDIPSFSASTTTYAVNVGSDVTHVKLTPTANHSAASVEVGKQGQTLAAVSSGSASAAIALSEGANPITVEVTAQDGQTTGTYTVTVTREAAGDFPGAPAAPTLVAGDTKIDVSWTEPDNGGLQITEYSVDYKETDAADTFAPGTNPAQGWVPLDPVTSTMATITGLTNGTSYDVRVAATNSYGTGEWSELSSATPTAGATRSTDATLSGLAATSSTSSSGPFDALALTPSVFAAATTSYTASVANDVTHVKLTPTVNDSNASVEVGKQGQTLAAVSSGTPSAAIALDEGANPVTVKVTAQDGQTTGTYTVTVTRAAPTTQPPCPDATPTAVSVAAVPIVVTSTTDDYFVLYVRHEALAGNTLDVPVSVTRGAAGTTTLSENIEALPAERYRVEKYLVTCPADVDGDGVDDLTELADPTGANPVNPAKAIAISDGAVAVPDQGTFEKLAYDVAPDLNPYFAGFEILKFVVFGLHTSPRAGVYFQNTEAHPDHRAFLSVVDLDQSDAAYGRIVYDPNRVASDGSLGVFYWNWDRPYEGFSTVARIHTLLAASMPLLDDNLAYYLANVALPNVQSALPSYRASRIPLVFEKDVFGETGFLALNPGVGVGRLRALAADARPHPRDIVLYEALPNELPRVAGIISTVPQTPLSHVNLRAVQDGIPNAFIRDARDRSAITALLDSYVRYEVTKAGYTLRAATKSEVDGHYESARPARPQTPERDLSVITITPLGQVAFEDWKAFGVKAANVAVLGTLGFPAGTVPDGFAIPFYFYDRFMRETSLGQETVLGKGSGPAAEKITLAADVKLAEAVDAMLAHPVFQTDFEVQDEMLDDLRDAIKDAQSPQWIIDALTAMHATYPDGQSLRYRSSTNNEDLPGFNGAGLYDSYTQKPEETTQEGIDKSLKQVFASLWTFRAFTEREFHRIDHLKTAMGVLVHPNYTDELVNGVAVSFDPTRSGFGDSYYVNSQVGEDLVTNPDAHSVPEELLLLQEGGYRVLATSNLVEPGQLLMSDARLGQLRQHLKAIHNHFKRLYIPASGEPFAMEIEFKITSANQLAIKQARPWVFGTPADGEGDPPPSGGGGPPPGGGGGPPPSGGGPPPSDDDDDDDGGGGGPPPGGGGPPRAAITTDADCDETLCRALTGERVSFEDTGSGTVRSRLWDFGDGRTSRSRATAHVWSEPGFYTVTLRLSDGEVESTASLTFLVEAAAVAGTCMADDETRCLRDSRFAVEMEWWTGDGRSGPGRVVREGTNDSALFQFFEEDNWEVLVKVLDGCSINGHVWVYGASATTLGYRIRVTDTVTGAVREYLNEDGRQADAITDATAFAGVCGDRSFAASAALPPEAATPWAFPAGIEAASEAVGCTESATTLCLLDGRYEVSVSWSAPGAAGAESGEAGPGRVLRPRTPDSGLFYFFAPDNWEMLVKVLDGCSYNDRVWVFAASATDLGLDLTVRDTVTGALKNYVKDPGKPAPAIADLSAFSDGCSRD